MGLLRRSNHETSKTSEEGTAETEMISRIRRYKKIGLLSAAVLATVLMPLAVQGLSGLNDTEQDSETRAGADPAQGGNVQSSTTEKSKNKSSTSVDVSTNNSSSGNGNSSSVDVNINGQSIPVPQSGSFHKTITSDGNQTTVDVNIQNHQVTSGNSQSHSSTNIDVDSGLGDRLERRERDHDRDR
jgi:hypothetical protein